MKPKTSENSRHCWDFDILKVYLFGTHIKGFYEFFETIKLKVKMLLQKEGMMSIFSHVIFLVLLIYV